MSNAISIDVSFYFTSDFYQWLLVFLPGNQFCLGPQPVLHATSLMAKLAFLIDREPTISMLYIHVCIASKATHT